MSVNLLSDFSFTALGDVVLRDNKAANNKVAAQSFSQLLASDSPGHVPSEKDVSISVIEAGKSFEVQQYVLSFSDGMAGGDYSAIQDWPQLLSYATGVDGMSLKFGSSREIGVMTVDVSSPISDGIGNSHNVKGSRDLLARFWGDRRSTSGEAAGRAAYKVERFDSRIPISPHQTSHTAATWSSSSLPNRSVLFLVKNEVEDDGKNCSIFVRNYGESLENSGWLFDMIPLEILESARVYFNGEALDYVR
ncbi:hypothetical protein JF535_14955 [Microbulbifer salipaludis]|uniref:Uncharacterized protein n=1 Tax=Microbulbifer salipaludis TaxID=187980 RepID=A0ABS3EAQ9_9GAMM|nr:hypothetical protein [Microbulbifer salipaludis]MBN8432149.1 hypothetical protein [Microbulbifer salipaludis]